MWRDTETRRSGVDAGKGGQVRRRAPAVQQAHADRDVAALEPGLRRRLQEAGQLRRLTRVADEPRGTDDVDHPTGVRRRVPRVHAERDQDRKSTRLNSSHANISYAVFCLKKK